MKTIKKYVVILLGVCLAAVLTACSSPDGGGKITKIEDLSGKTVAVISGPVPIELARSVMEDELDITLKELLYFDTLGAAAAALESNKVDAVLTSDFSADYYVQRNSGVDIIKISKENTANIHMAMRNGDAELISAINDAILSMKDDGTLDGLKQTYVTGLKAADQLTGKDLPKLSGAPTVYVGISGDIPPLDYIAADGRPAGYSLEVLSEISRRAGYNFEIVSMANETKFTALAAGKIDLFFFHVIDSNNRATVETAAANPDIAFSEPYYTSGGTVFLIKK